VAQPAVTPPARKTVDTLLDDARGRLMRLDPHQAHAADGALLIDIRSETQRAADGVVPGAICVPRNVVEWRCDPRSPAHHPHLGGFDRPLIVVCEQGYQSSLAAATLQQLGFHRATDVVGGVEAWLAVHEATQEELMRAIECPCGHHLEGADDEELFLLARDHVDREHPEMERSDEQLRERVAADAYDVPVAAGR
jgi:rhodanese-related sulfurtransferase